MAAINQYGDQLLPTTGKHGADIARQRIDDLDLLALQFALEQANGGRVALDLGGGAGAQALRFASLGLETLLIDRLPREQTLLRAEGLGDILPLRYRQADLAEATAGDFPPDITLCFSQRFIHYLDYAQAQRLLGHVRQRMHRQGKLFLSASGLRSELGEGYDGGASMAQRFAPLSAAMAARHGIHEPVCLYTGDELAALCSQCGFAAERVFSSAFGNVKGVFVPVG